MDILFLISNIMVSVLLIYFGWLFLCDIIGLFSKKKKYGEAEPSNVAVIVCARNEEKVIGNLLDSLKKQQYPQDKMKVFVVAHNCSDNTADIAREQGAVVYVRNNPDETFKGQALHFGVDQIKKDYPGVFDVLCVFDADNVAGKGFLKEINAAIQSGADVVQGFRNSKNYHSCAISELFGAYWYQIMICQNLPHTTMHLPATIGGTGFAVTMDALGDTWQTFTMLEDIEFTCQMVLAGKKCILAPYAMFYDEQPESFRMGMRQRYRWSVGGFQLLRMYFPKLIKAVSKRGIQAVKMVLDLLINPVLLVSLLGYILEAVGCAITGGINGLLWFVLTSVLVVWFSVLPVTFILFIKQKMNPFKNISTILWFPFFVLVSMIFVVPAMFYKNPKWKPIAHSDTKTIDALEE